MAECTFAVIPGEKNRLPSPVEVHGCQKFKTDVHTEIKKIDLVRDDTGDFFYWIL